jgi:hypothetical protein
LICSIVEFKSKFRPPSSFLTSISLSHSPTLSLSCALTLSLSYSLTFLLFHPLTLSFSHPLTSSPSHSLTFPLSHLLALSLSRMCSITPLLSHSHTLALSISCSLATSLTLYHYLSHFSFPHTNYLFDYLIYVIFVLLNNCNLSLSLFPSPSNFLLFLHSPSLFFLFQNLTFPFLFPSLYSSYAYCFFSLSFFILSSPFISLSLFVCDGIQCTSKRA